MSHADTIARIDQETAALETGLETLNMSVERLISGLAKERALAVEAARPTYPTPEQADALRALAAHVHDGTESAHDAGASVQFFDIPGAIRIETRDSTIGQAWDLTPGEIDRVTEILRGLSVRCFGTVRGEGFTDFVVASARV